MEEVVSSCITDFPKGISLATYKDISELTATINDAYIGDGKGWADANYMVQNKPRITEKQVEDYIVKPGNAFLKYTCADGTIGGCLFLEDIGEKRFHLWAMAVSPSIQKQGIGRKLLEASITHARQKNYKLIEFTTTAARPHVVAWYERCGFTNTGEIIDFDLSTVLPFREKDSIVQEVVFVKYL